MNCPVCSASCKRWSEVNGYVIKRCRPCGYAFVDPRPSAKEIIDFYREGETGLSLDEAVAKERSFPNTTVDAHRAIRRISTLNPTKGRLLDVGCGQGFFAKEAQDDGFTVDAIEIADAQRACAAQMLGTEPLDVPFEEFSEERPYDAIVMSQILEHVIDVNEWIRKARRLLGPAGILFVASPSFASFFRRLLQARDPYVTPPVHLNYFSPDNLALLLRKHGFQVLGVETVSRIPYDTLSRRLPVAKGASEWLLKVGQRPVLRAADAAGLGIFVNAYAQAV